MPEQPIRKAVVLAAGRGTRMGAITEEIPKPMLPVHGRPLLERIMEQLAEAGVGEFFVVTGYRREPIETHFRNWKLPVAFGVQSPADGTGSAARLARGFVAGEPFLLSFGDCLCAAAEYVRCKSILERNPHTTAVIAAKDMGDPWQGAAVYEENGRISRIVEKPPKGTSATPWGSAGFYAFRPLIFDYLDRLTPSTRNEYELTAALGMLLNDGLEVRLSSVEGDWRDVGRPEDLAAVNAE